jgi:Asp-tRNA(Asn)/Glu-tRNA(Gln) amidotransferase A subunit family amidase
MKAMKRLGIGMAVGAILLSVVATFGAGAAGTATADPWEWTVAQIHDALRRGETTCERLVEAYIERIETYDQSTGLNAIVVVNPDAPALARELDAEFQRTGELRPMHGVPLIVKDNYNTRGLQTTAGFAGLKGFEPDEDAHQVRKLVEAGGIVLAKSNMAEWAFSPMHTTSSTAGETLNPYDFARVPAGSSGGTAAAVAASFGAVGLGTDTGNSIRGPSSHCALVGFRSTLGLTSRHGIVPLYLRNDVGGPICRTVEDATRVLEVIAGYDSRDPITRHCRGKVPFNYTQFLRADGLQGARIGVLRELSDADPHPGVASLFEQALADLARLGAEVVDPFEVEGFRELAADQWCAEFKKDIEAYLQAYVGDEFVQSLDAIVETGIYADEMVKSGLDYAMANEGRGGESTTPCGDPFTDPRRVAFREAIEQEMDRLELDAIVYPSWNHPPAKLAEFRTAYKGDNSQIIAPHTGQPAFTVPMGFVEDTWPAGLQILGRMFDETTLIRIAYAFEQGTRHRVPPAVFPPLSSR